MAAILAVAAAAAVLWMALTVALLWHRQERIVFQPPAAQPEPPAIGRRVEFQAPDSQPLFAFVVEPRDGRRVTDLVVVAFHGNADLSAWLVPWAREVAEQTGAVVVLPEYRGYGGLPGTPSYAASARDAQGALGWVRKHYRGRRVALFGHSLGSAIAAELGRHMADEPPVALILQSPFTSARAMAARMLVPPIPGLWPLISRVHYDTERIVAALEVPVWVAHGTRDVVIPVRMGRRVFAAARRPGELLVVTGAGHNDVPDAGGPAYWRWLARALSAPGVELEEKRGRRLPGLV